MGRNRGAMGALWGRYGGAIEFKKATSPTDPGKRYVFNDG